MPSRPPTPASSLRARLASNEPNGLQIS